MSQHMREHETAGTASPAGRRERNRVEKLRRIFASAQALFDQFGYEAVTTQQIADHADVAVGTVFIYARTKAELLLMVQNRTFAAAVRDGERRVEHASPPSPAEAILTLLEPMLEEASMRPENVSAYQRELLFGSSTEQYRSEGIAIVLDLEQRIAELLSGDSSLPPARAAARSIFGVFHLTISQVTTGVHGTTPDRDLLSLQIAQIIAGYKDLTNQPTHEGA